MRRPTLGLHPSFDELSAHADRADTHAPQSRVGRHVAKCAACREVVAEIRALGQAARSTSTPGGPVGMWARIERALDAGTSSGPAVEHPVSMSASSDLAPEATIAAGRSGGSKALRRTSVGLMLVLAATAAVIAIDAREPLAAATPRRLSTDREFARPGTAITFRYRPTERLATERSLTIWMFVSGRNETRFDQPLERAGTLHRVSAMSYIGSVVMPDSTPMATFVVGDSTGEIIDRPDLRARQFPTVVLAADSRGRPRLDALVMALGSGRGSPDSATMFRWAKQMRELYPSEPETWILSDRYTHRGMIGDIVKWFESRERRYYGWHDRLEHRRGLSEETETMMASLGWELMDTARAEFWTTRLIQEHPTSPWAPMLWIQRYRDVPSDSAAVVLREFEAIYARAGLSGTARTYGVLSRAISLADRSGDSTLIRRWHSRVDPRDISWLLGTELTRMAGDRAALDDVRRRLLDALAEADSATHGGPTLWGRDRVFAAYERQRVRTRLAAVQLVEGDARGSKEALDSIITRWEARPFCPTPESMRWRAEASRALGRLDSARADLAYVATTENWQLQLVRDSAAALLGPAFAKASWDSALVAARAYHRRCFVAARDAQRSTTP